MNKSMYKKQKIKETSQSIKNKRECGAHVESLIAREISKGRDIFKIK